MIPPTLINNMKHVIMYDCASSHDRNYTKIHARCQERRSPLQLRGPRRNCGPPPQLRLFSTAEFPLQFRNGLFLNRGFLDALPMRLSWTVGSPPQLRP